MAKDALVTAFMISFICWVIKILGTSIDGVI